MINVTGILSRLMRNQELGYITESAVPKKKTLLEQMKDEPEKFILTAFIEGDELKISVKKKEEGA